LHAAGQNGVDFAAEHQALISKMGVKLILMSGIMTDNAFAKYATGRSKAIAFLPKPFDLNQALKIVQSGGEIKGAGVNAASPGRLQFYRSLFSATPSVAEKRKTLASIGEAFGFDLIAAINSIFDLKISGFLNLEWSNGERASVTFSRGLITAVDVADSTTKMGVLLLQNGFVLKEDLDELLASPQGSGRLGQRLIQGNKLSPHAFDLVFVEQIRTRIDKMIHSGRVKIGFAEAEVALSGSHLDKDALNAELRNWIESKLNKEFVLDLINSFQEDESIGPSPQFRVDHPVCGYQSVKPLAKKVSAFKNPVTFKEWLPTLQDSEESLKALFFMLIKNQLSIFPKGQTQLISKEAAVSTPVVEEVTPMASENSVTSISDFVTAVTKLTDKDTSLSQITKTKKIS